MHLFSSEYFQPTMVLTLLCLYSLKSFFWFLFQILFELSFWLLITPTSFRYHPLFYLLKLIIQCFSSTNILLVITNILTLFYLSNLSFSSFFFASSYFNFASNSSLLFCIARFIPLVLDGFYAALSSVLVVENTFLVKAALNLSIGGIVAYACEGPSFKYSLSRVFEEVLVKLGDLGLVTCIWLFFLFNFWLNLSCCFLNCSLVTSSLILGLKEWPSTWVLE